MAATAASSGTVIGLDHDPVMVDQARVRLADRTNVEILTGDAQAMPLADGTVDRARTDRMLQHVPDPGRVVAEFRRVARPGAVIAMAEPDWHGLLIDSPAGQGLVRYITTEVIRNPAVGRSLVRLAEQAGLTVRTAVVFSPVIRDGAGCRGVLGVSMTVRVGIRAPRKGPPRSWSKSLPLPRTLLRRRRPVAVLKCTGCGRHGSDLTPKAPRPGDGALRPQGQAINRSSWP
ncbi:methyltransferase domain-containing protein [Nonomuraea sp. NPDC026600]|uniref:methyltransferase domain-containing protein n=1 Tax=Nonomuraea sp. NPDC026600 TaxID=3155363 RepID=UPI0033F4EC26